MITGVPAVVLTAAAACPYFKTFWRFNILNPKHWSLILDKWNNGWVVSKTTEYLFLFSLLMLPVAALIVWIVFYKLRWKKILTLPLAPLRNRQKKTLEKRSLAAAVGKPEDLKKAPAPKHAAHKVPDKLSRLRGTQAPQQHSAPAAANTASAAASAPSGDFWSDLAARLENAGVFVLREMKIGSCPTNLIAVTQDGLFMLCAGPEDGQVWTTRDRANPPVWTTETNAVIPSPLAVLQQGRAALRKLLAENGAANLNVNACLFLDHGQIANLTDTLNYLAEIDLTVLRMPTCSIQDLPDTNAIVEYIKSQPASDKTLNDVVAVALLSMMSGG